MTYLQLNKLNSFLNLQAACSAHFAVYSTLIAFQQTYDAFASRVTRLGKLRLAQEEETSGLAADKKRLREEACRAAVVIVNATRVYAMQHHNLELAAKVDYSYSDLFYGRDSASGDRCQIVHNMASDHLAALAPFGVTEEKLEELQEKIDAYAPTIPKPRHAITSCATVTEQVEEEFAAADKLVNEGLDKLIVQFQGTAPQFYADYTNARVIVDAAATRETGTEVQTPTQSQAAPQNGAPASTPTAVPNPDEPPAASQHQAA